MIRAVWYVVVLALSASTFCSGAALGARLRCDVIEHSDAGGTVEVITDDNPAPAWWPAGNAPQIHWKPAPTSTSPRLVLGFSDSTLKSMGNVPRGGHIRFRIPPPNEPDDTQVILGLPDGENLVFQREQLLYGHDFGSDDETQPVMDIGFTEAIPDWPAIKSAIMSEGSLSVKLVRSGKTLSQTTFNLGNRQQRDSLFAAAVQKIAEADPKVCTTAPHPVVYMTPGSGNP